MRILRLEEIRQSEREAVCAGTDYATLMKRAGVLAAKRLCASMPVAGKKITVVCGKGNNGGDGLVMAEYLAVQGAFIQLCLPLGVPTAQPAGEYSYIIERLSATECVPKSCDILIDALLGIGLDRPAEGRAAEIIRQMNDCRAFKAALDLPSGVFCDEGTVKTVAFRADVTYTMIAAKPCFFLPEAGAYCGGVEVLDIGTPVKEGTLFTIEPPCAAKRKKYSHKGSFGTALLLCGSYGKSGAEILAARAALRSGVGIVRAAVCDKNYSAFCSAVPEAVTLPMPTSLSGTLVIDDITLAEELSAAGAVLIGCGLSQSAETERLLRRAVAQAEVPVVIDADGINLLCRDISIIRNTKAPIVITPHPKEMARLCNTTVARIEGDRIGYARDFAVSHRCVVVLKGANTIVAEPDGRIFFNTTGNAGLATGGSGDVLAGILVSLLAQGRGLLEAACAAVYLHGSAADRALEECSASALLPSDVIEELKRLEI